jgi:hypothetical protein
MDGLVEHIRKLRQLHGRPVALSARDAGQVIGKSHQTAARRLSALVSAGRLVLVREGRYGTNSIGNMASEYDFLPPAPLPIRCTRSGGPAQPPPYMQTKGGLVALWWFSTHSGQWIDAGDENPRIAEGFCIFGCH